MSKQQIDNFTIEGDERFRHKCKLKIDTGWRLISCYVTHKEYCGEIIPVYSAVFAKE